MDSKPYNRLNSFLEKTSLFGILSIAVLLNYIWIQYATADPVDLEYGFWFEPLIIYFPITVAILVFVPVNIFLRKSLQRKRFFVYYFAVIGILFALVVNLWVLFYPYPSQDLGDIFYYLLLGAGFVLVGFLIAFLFDRSLIRFELFDVFQRIILNFLLPIGGAIFLFPYNFLYLLSIIPLLLVTKLVIRTRGLSNKL